MVEEAKFGRRLVAAGIMLALIAVPCLAQNRRTEQHSNPPRPSYQQPSRPPAAPRQQRSPAPRYQQNRPPSEPRYQSRPQSQPRYQPQPRRGAEPAPTRNYDVPRPYTPPSQGRHSGQWLYQHREQPLDQQRRALENDPNFRRLPAQRQQQLEQRLQHFDSLPPDRQQEVLRRMETWEHLTSAQKQQFRSMDSQFRNLPPERQRAVRNAIQSLRAMPPQARQRAVDSGRFNDFSPQERQILNNAARLPLAPAQGEQPTTGPNRYIPRPPQ